MRRRQVRHVVAEGEVVGGDAVTERAAVVAEHREQRVGHVVLEPTPVREARVGVGLTLGDVDEFVGDLADSTTVALPNVFSFSVANNVPDGHVALLTMHIEFNDTLGYDVPLSVVLQAPKLDALIVSIQDFPNGDSDGRLESGETALVKIRNFNTGASLSPEATGVD